VNNKEQDSLAHIAAAWKHAPHKLISLRDMIEIPVHDVWLALENLQFYKEESLKMLSDPDSKPTANQKRAIDTALTKLRPFCKTMVLIETEGRIAGLLRTLVGLLTEGNDCTHNILASEIGQLQHAFWYELTDRKFVFIPKNKVKYFERKKLFGVRVHISFPSARIDIKDAGNCLAVDLNTSAVFHLMRVVEIGLRAFAKYLKVKIKKTPLEYADWGKILDEIDLRIEAIREKHQPKPKRTKDLEFYSGVWAEFNGFKDVWRNNVMHARRTYSEQEALGVYLHVENFMRRLGEVISGK
jgi:hypothetical protein